MRIAWDRTKGRPEPIAALNKIIERENGEPLVDLRLVAPTALIYRESVIPFARKTVAEMVERAARSLPKGFRMGIVDAWRPIERQRRIYEWVTKCAMEAFPHRSHAAIRRTVNRWAAPVDQKAPPGHCTGAALDVWLIDVSGEVVDVSSPYERFSAAPTFTLGLSEEAKSNRMILYDAMMDAGFSNCRDEWWHYSYGDAAWAVREGLDECMFGLIELGYPELYAEQERLAYERLLARENPFLTGR